MNSSSSSHQQQQQQQHQQQHQHQQHQHHPSFRPSSISTYSSIYFFYLTFPSIFDLWRSLLDSQQDSNPKIYRFLSIIHRSFKFIYRFTSSLLTTLNSYEPLYPQPSTELARALDDLHPSSQSIPIHQLTQPIYLDHQSTTTTTSSDDDEQDVPLPSTWTVWRVDRIIHHSRRLETTKFAIDAQDCDPIELAQAIIAIKNINPIFSSTLTRCLERIKSASRARKSIEVRSSTPYDPELHHTRFHQLFKLLKPDKDYDSLPPKAWQLIGFQGTDPSTDLRGAGILGLDALMVFGRYFGLTAQHLVTEAVEGGSSWYPWALASINVTWWCISLVKHKKLDHFLFSASSNSTTSRTLENLKPKKTNTEEGLMKDIPIELGEFLLVQVKLTYLFHQFWIHLDPKPTVMEFEAKFKLFKSIVQVGLTQGLIGGLGLGWMVDPSPRDHMDRFLIGRS